MRENNKLENGKEEKGNYIKKMALNTTYFYLSESWQLHNLNSRLPSKIKLINL